MLLYSSVMSTFVLLAMVVAFSGGAVVMGRRRLSGGRAAVAHQRALDTIGRLAAAHSEERPALPDGLRSGERHVRLVRTLDDPTRPPVAPRLRSRPRHTPAPVDGRGGNEPGSPEPPAVTIVASPVTARVPPPPLPAPQRVEPPARSLAVPRPPLPPPPQPLPVSALGVPPGPLRFDDLESAHAATGGGTSGRDAGLASETDEPAKPPAAPAEPAGPPAPLIVAVTRRGLGGTARRIRASLRPLVRFAATVAAPGTRHLPRPTLRLAAAATAALLVAAAAIAAGGALLQNHPHAAPPVAQTPRRPAVAATVPSPSTTSPTTVPPPTLVAGSTGYSLYRLPVASTILVAAAGRCWVEIRGHGPSGRLIYEGILVAGQSTSAKGRVWVRLGNPTAVTVSVNGHDLAPPAMVAGVPYDLQFE